MDALSRQFGVVCRASVTTHSRKAESCSKGVIGRAHICTLCTLVPYVRYLIVLSLLVDLSDRFQLNRFLSLKSRPLTSADIGGQSPGCSLIFSKQRLDH